MFDRNNDKLNVNFLTSFWNLIQFHVTKKKKKHSITALLGLPCHQWWRINQTLNGKSENYSIWSRRKNIHAEVKIISIRSFKEEALSKCNPRQKKRTVRTLFAWTSDITYAWNHWHQSALVWPLARQLRYETWQNTKRWCVFASALSQLHPDSCSDAVAPWIAGCETVRRGFEQVLWLLPCCMIYSAACKRLAERTRQMPSSEQDGKNDNHRKLSFHALKKCWKWWTGICVRLWIRIEFWFVHSCCK